ncbi:SH3 domain-containing protein [Peribacillus sp. SCS-37]|uniref:SH3 domain-containing protein n=1 Tax=Paraperibacillus esterisolvens TaxID=3115296 RepID=UPI0039068770
MSKKILAILTAMVILFSMFVSLNPVSAGGETKYVTASALNVRSGPSTEHKVIAVIKMNQAVVVSGTSGYWKKITVRGKTGWASGKYLASTAPKSAGNLADRLKTVGANKQLILVTTNGYTTTAAGIKTFEKDSKGKWVQKMSVRGYVGKKGIGKGKEGDAKTPAGKYTISTTFGQKGNPGTKMPFRKITSDDVWVDDSNSKLYNTWQSRRKTQGQWKSAENMNHRLYTNGFVIDYNTARVPGAGSAIFFHVGSSYTLGCVATAESNVVSVMKWLDPSKKPVIIMTAAQDLNKY